MSIAWVFDTETTGLAGELIQAGWIEFLDNRLGGATRSHLQNYQPSVPIEFGAMAVHHIIDADLVGCPPSSSFALPADVQYLIGHNIDFDWQVIGSPAHLKRIDTLAIARKLYPEASHTLSALIYRHYEDKAKAREWVKSAHNAQADGEMTLWLLRQMVKTQPSIRSWEDLWQFSEACRIPEIMPFGKHKNTAIKDLPLDYVQWLRRQDDCDPYLLKALSLAFDKQQ